MKLFASKFTQTLIFNVATIAAIVVGIVQFTVRAWNENNCNAKVRQFVIQTLRAMNTVTALIYENLSHELPADPAPVTVRKVAQKRTKRA
jgi:hypothetical protein